jgi:hypothetical protein
MPNAIDIYTEEVFYTLIRKALNSKNGFRSIPVRNLRAARLDDDNVETSQKVFATIEQYVCNCRKTIELVPLHALHVRRNKCCVCNRLYGQAGIAPPRRLFPYQIPIVIEEPVVRGPPIPGCH